MKRLGYLKTWGASAPSCKDQNADARWVMAYSHKTQSFMKNGCQQKSLDKALEKYSEPCQITKTQLFAKTVNDFQTLTKLFS